MEIRHLIYFKTVAEELHFGRAAERLFMSQPPLSRQIKDLEDELGVILFFRTNKRVELTEAGKYFLEEVAEILQNIEHSKTITKQIHNNQKYASEYHRLVINTCNRMGFEPKFVHQSNSMSSILELVSQELGLAVVPASTIKQYPHLKLKVRKLEDVDSKTEVILVSNIKSKNSALGEFMECIQREYLNFNAS